MARLPHAAKVLNAQVVERKKQAKMVAASEPDGLGVVRTVSFNKATAKWLHPLLEVMGDPRIETTEVTADGLAVTFVASRLADDKGPFNFDDAQDVLSAEG